MDNLEKRFKITTVTFGEIMRAAKESGVQNAVEFAEDFLLKQKIEAENELFAVWEYMLDEEQKDD